jgi:hypothetical protein
MAKDKVKQARDKVAKVTKACSAEKLNASTAKKSSTRQAANKKALDKCIDTAMKAKN